MTNCGAHVSSTGANHDTTSRHHSKRNQRSRRSQRQRSQRNQRQRSRRHRQAALRLQLPSLRAERLNDQRRFVSCARLILTMRINAFEANKVSNVMNHVDLSRRDRNLRDTSLRDLSLHDRSRRDRSHRVQNQDPCPLDLNLRDRNRPDPSHRDPNLQDPNHQDRNLRGLNRHVPNHPDPNHPDPSLQDRNRHVQLNRLEVNRQDRRGRRDRTIYEGSIFMRGSLRTCPSMLASVSPTWVAPIRS